MDPRSVLAEFGTMLPGRHQGARSGTPPGDPLSGRPERPDGTQGWSDERLAALVTRNSMIGVEQAKSPETGWMNGAGPPRGHARFRSIVAEPQDIEPVFHADWERHVFSVSHRLVKSGHWSLDQFRSTIEQQPPSDYLRHSYYENWLGAIEKLVVEHRLLEHGKSLHQGNRHAASRPRSQSGSRAPAAPRLWRQASRSATPSGSATSTPLDAPGHPVPRGHVGEIVAHGGPQPIPSAQPRTSASPNMSTACASSPPSCGVRLQAAMWSSSTCGRATSSQ